MDLKFVFLWVLLSPAASGKDLKVEVTTGANATLLCDAGDVSIDAVEWTRSDLKSEYVLLYRDGHTVTRYQHPSFTDRVQLVDAELKNGNVSLILKNVNNNDTGTYECRVLAGGSGRKKRAIIETEPIRRIQLVTDSGSKNENTMNENTVDGNTMNENTMDGNAHKHVGLAAGGLVCSAVVVVGLVIRRKSKRQSDRNSEPAADEADVELV